MQGATRPLRPGSVSARQRFFTRRRHMVLETLAPAFRRASLQTKHLRRITMNFTRKTIHFLTCSIPRALPRFALLAAVALVPVAAHASSPWVQAISNLANDVTGPIAKGL